MEEDRLQVVFTTPDLVDATLYREMLEEAGIHVDTFDGTRDLAPFVGLTEQLAPHRLLVRSTDYERALAMITAYRDSVEHGDYALDNTDDDSDRGG